MIWGPRPKLRIAPPMGRELPTIHILAYTFEQSVRKLKFCVYGFLVVCQIRRCQLCQDWLNPLSAILKLSYIFISSEPFDISSQKSVGIINIMSWTYHRSMKTAPPTVREILRSLKKCLTFKILSQICTFDVILFPGLCWFWKCLICHFPKQRLSAVLK